MSYTGVAIAEFVGVALCLFVGCGVVAWLVAELWASADGGDA